MNLIRKIDITYGGNRLAYRWLGAQGFLLKENMVINDSTE